MRASGLGALGVLIALSAGPARSEAPPFVLLVPDQDVPTEDIRVSAESAFGIARSYGLDPEVGRISLRLCSDDRHVAFWDVKYIDFSGVEGTIGFSVDAIRGIVVDRLVAMGSDTKQRRQFEIDPAEARVDSCPPAAPRIRFAGAKRGHHPQGPCLRRMDVEEARRGIIEAYLLELADDRTPCDDMGFVLEQLGGIRPLPESWAPRTPFHPQIKFHPDSLMVFITWDDGNDDIQEAVSTRFAVYAIDRAGNRSAIPDTLVVELPGG